MRLASLLASVLGMARAMPPCGWCQVPLAPVGLGADWNHIAVIVINLDSRRDRLEALAERLLHAHNKLPFSFDQVCRMPAVNASATLGLPPGIISTAAWRIVDLVKLRDDNWLAGGPSGSLCR